MSSPRRQERFSEEVGHLAAEFLERESDGRTLITITRTEISPDLKYVTVYCSIFPESAEERAMGFVTRKAKEFPKFLAGRGQFGRLPRISFKSDKGEIKRQHLDTVFRAIEEEDKKRAS